MALRVAVQYMARVNPEVADRAVDVAYGRAPNEQGKTHGLKSVQHFFSAGARFLKRLGPHLSLFVADVQHLLLCRSNFSGAANTAECLLLLSRALPWKTAVATTIRQNLEGKPEVDRLVAGSRLAASAQRKLDWSYPEAGNPVRVSSFSCRKWIWGRSSACWSVQGSPRYVSHVNSCCARSVSESPSMHTAPSGGQCPVQD